MIPPECQEMSSSRLDLKILSEVEVSVREDSEAFQASKASTINLDKEAKDKLAQGILLETFLKNSKSFSADSKGRGVAEELKLK